MKNSPKLRFPEFVNDGEWEEKALNKISEIIMGQSPDSNTYNTVQDGKPLIQGNADILNRKTNPRIWTTESTKECQEGDIILTVRAPVGAVAKSFHNACIGRGVCAIQPKESSEFLYQFLLTQEDKWDKLSQGSTFTAINSNEIRNFKLNIPKSNEQQKIADCLSSVDYLISAQSRKVKLLKEHKKGLMQQLFPQDGEEVPKLRFPEFKNAPKWEEKILGDVVDYENGKAHENDISENGKYTVVNSKFISTEGDIRKYTNKAFCLANVDDILMVLSDIPNGRAIAKCYLVESDDLYTVNQRICRLSSKKAVSKFLFYILDKNKYFLSFDDGVKQTNLRKEDVLNCPMLVPLTKEEQQKIADCLSSVDEQITSQTQKLQTLKEHKKALMQQLFPKSM